jgi:tetratricopeptide (TPR) repeat protein
MADLMKQSGYRGTRNMEMQFLFECPRCSKEKAICYEIPLVEDDKHIYIQVIEVGQSSSPYLEKLPVVNISVDEQERYTVEDFFENLGGGKLKPISGKKLKEIGLVIRCPYCEEKAHFFLGVGIIRNKEGRVLLQKDADTPGVFGSPIVLLGSDRRGHFNIVTFLNPVSKSHEDARTAELELDKDQAQRPFVEEDEIVRERAAEMISESNAAIQSNPNDVEAYYKRAMAYMLERDYDSAFQEFNRAIELNPDYAPAITKRGVIYGIKGEFDLAVKDFNRAIELDPVYPPTYLNRGICYYETDNTGLALRDLDKVLEISSEPMLVKQARQYSVLCKRRNDLRECEKGTVHINNRQYDEAITELEGVIESNPGNAAAYFYLGMAYDNQKNYELAVAALDKAIELDPEFPGAHNNRGWVHLKTAHYTRAIADFTEEIAFNPNLVAAYLNRANAYHDIRQYRLAVADLEKALKLSTDSEQRTKIQRQIEAISNR